MYGQKVLVSKLFNRESLEKRDPQCHPATSRPRLSYCQVCSQLAPLDGEVGMRSVDGAVGSQGQSIVR